MASVRPLRIGFNSRVLEKPSPTGTARYAHSLLAAMNQLNPDGIAYHLFGASEIPFQDTEGIISRVRGCVAPHSGPWGHFWEQVTLPRIIGKSNVDLFHTPAGHPPILTKTPQVLTIHDVSPITHPEWFSNGYAALYRLLTPISIRVSEQILTVSEFARKEITDRYPSAAGKTVAIHNGVEPIDVDNTVPVESHGVGKFLLFVGANTARKNLNRLLKAYRRYRRSASDPLNLMLVGPSNNVLNGVPIPSDKGIRAFGYIPDGQLAWLYHNAAAFVFPSLYEGFGLPILEAMSAGTPVVTSDRGAMAEVAGDAACLVDPEDPYAIAAGIERVLDDREYADALRRAGRERAAEFTWERTARETLEVYREVAEET